MSGIPKSGIPKTGIPKVGRKPTLGLSPRQRFPKPGIPKSGIPVQMLRAPLQI